MDRESLHPMLLSLGVLIHEKVLPQLRDTRASAFLVGGALDSEGTVRSRLYDQLRGRKGLALYLPEHLFTELFYESKHDFLSLENILAESVHCIVMCIESPGSFVEFGAFVNHEKLRERMVAVVNSKYRKAKSFINLGPIRFLENHKCGKVLWHDYEKGDYRQLANDIHMAVYFASKSQKIRYDLLNPIVAEAFVLAVLYCLGSVTRRHIAEIVENTSITETESGTAMCLAALSSLFRQRLVFSRGRCYRLTPAGHERLRWLIGDQYLEKVKLLDDIRVQVLRLTLKEKA